MEYGHELIGTIGVSTESYSGKKLAVSVGTDTHGMCTISFGSSYSIRINEDDVDALRDILYDAGRKLMIQRVNKEYDEAAAAANVKHPHA